MYSWTLLLQGDAIVGTNRRELHYTLETRDWTVVDTGTGRAILKRGKYVDRDPSGVYPGLRIVLNTCVYEVVDYGNEFTRRRLEKYSCHGLILVEPPALAPLISTVDMLAPAGIALHNLKVVNSTSLELKGETEGVKDVERGSVLLEVVGTVERIKGLSSDVVEVLTTGGKEISGILESAPTLPISPDCALLIVLPSSTGELGDILRDVTGYGRLEINYITKALFTQSTFQLLFGCYKGIISCFAELESEAVSSQHIGIIVSRGKDAPEDMDACECLRTLSGVQYMADPSVARALDPSTLLAKYGRTRSKPGVIVSEVGTYAEMECAGYKALVDHS